MELENNIQTNSLGNTEKAEETNTPEFFDPVEKLKKQIPKEADNDYTYTILRYTENLKGRPKKEILDSYNGEFLDIADIIRIYGGGRYSVHLKYKTPSGKDKFYTADFNIAGDSILPDRKSGKINKETKEKETAKDIEYLSGVANLIRDLTPPNRQDNPDSSLLITLLLENRKSEQQQQQNMFNVLMQQQHQQNQILLQAMQENSSGLLQGIELAQELGANGSSSGNTLTGVFGQIIGNALKAYVGNNHNTEEEQNDTPELAQPDFFGNYIEKEEEPTNDEN